MEYIQFAISHWELSLALVVTLLMLGWNIYGHKIQGYTPISAEQAVNIINKNNGLIVDVRSNKEVSKTGLIKNSKHIELSAIHSTEAKKIGDTKNSVIVICHSGSRSGIACSALKKKGFNQVYNLKGGINSWIKSGYPLTKSKK